VKGIHASLVVFTHAQEKGDSLWSLCQSLGAIRQKGHGFHHDALKFPENSSRARGISDDELMVG
jgi:hypothetical protein